MSAPVPETLNHYRIIAPLGRGGMGEVFVAEDTRLNRKVALKVLSKVMAGDPERRQRFEREAQAVAALNHPNIVTIYSVEEAEGIPFLTMELVEGRPLSEMIQSGGLPVDALLRIGIGVTDAIGAAHQRGITHRDLKPANVIVTPDARVKVLDFGLAKLREAHLQENGEDLTRMPTSDLTGEGRIIGTVAYMSPEQAEGKPVDPRSDIFSLGVVLHELATGERPFKGDTNVSVISSILKDTPLSVTDVNPSLPAELAKVIRRALSKDPSRRYQTATDMRNDLEELKQEIDSGVTVSMAAPRVAPAAGAGRSRKLLMAALAGIGIVALGAAYWTFNVRQAESRVLVIDRLTRLTSTGNASLAATSPDGRYVVHVKNDGGAPSLWVRQTGTTSDVQIVPPASVRYDGVTYARDGDHVYYVVYELTGGVATLYRIATLGGTPQKILEDVDSRISFSPDAKQFTFTRGAPLEGTAWLMVANADGTGARQLAELAAPDQFTLNGPAWSPDGQTIVAPAQSLRDGPHALIVAVDVASGVTETLEGRWGFVGDLEWLPDGRSFVAAATQFAGTLQLWQVEYPGSARRRLTNDLNSYISSSLSADGQTLATVQAENISNLYVAPAGDPGGGTQLTRGRGRGDGQAGIDWVSADRIVFTSNASGRPQIWAVDANGENLTELTREEDPALAPSVTPDGRSIVFQRFGKDGMTIWRMNPDGSDQRQLTKAGLEFGPQAAPDGFVYFNSVRVGAPRPFKVPIEGGEPVSLGDHYFRPVDVSADGKELLGVGWDEKGRRSSVAIMPVTGGPPSLIPQLPANGITWGPGRTITFGAPEKDGVRVYRYSPGAKAPESIGVIPDAVFGYAWARDGSRAAISRGQSVSDVVLISLKSGTE